MNLTQKSLFRFLSIMVMVSTFLPVVFVNLPPVVKSHHIWTTLWLLSILFLKMDIFTNKLLASFVGYMIMMFTLIFTLWDYIDVWNKTQISMELYELIVAFTVITYYRTERDYEGLAKLVKISFICIVITSILSIVTSIINPTYARDIIGVDTSYISSENEYILSFQKYGGGGYSLFSAIIGLFPILFYLHKNNIRNNMNKKLLVIIGLIFVTCLISVQIFANILVAVFTILICFMGTKNINKSIFLSLVFVSIILFIPTSSYVDFLTYLSRIFPVRSELSNKFQDMAMYMTFGDINTGAGGRAARFPLLLESFLSNPLTGGENWNGHMYWMNKLAVYGLLGTLPFISILYMDMKKNIKMFNKEFIFYYLVSIISIIVLGLLKALDGRDLWYVYIVIIPGMYYYNIMLSNKNIKDRTKTSANDKYFG